MEAPCSADCTAFVGARRGEPPRAGEPAITKAAPAVGPLASLNLQRLQLQRVVLGPVSIEYADLFVAAVLGAVLAADSRNRGLASLLGAGAATSLGAFFLVTNVLPATVPAAVALGLEELRSHGRIGQMSPPSTARSSARRIVRAAEPGNRPGSHDAPGARP